MPEILKFDQSQQSSNIIKVIGVGGGGSNAVTHMYKQGIKGVDFIICNTDAQAMESSPVPIKVQLGTHLTSGLGAGAVPSVGRNAALEDADKIKEVLEPNTKMVFITAGFGGGTGTGAAPVIARIAKELDILTVGIVTLPFAFEGRKRKLHAEEGIKQIKEHVDALLIISNDKLRELCGNLRLSEALAEADDVLTTAAKGIAELITVTGYINVDFEDVKTVMQDSGVAIMGTGVAEGENRAIVAVEAAIESPLLNNNDIEGAGNMLLYIASGKEEITMDEVTEITEFIQQKTKSSAEVIWGNGCDESLGDKISVTIIATGFEQEQKKKTNNVVRDLYENDETPITPPVPEVISRHDDEGLRIRKPDLTETSMIRKPEATDKRVITPLYEPEPEPEPQAVEEPDLKDSLKKPEEPTPRQTEEDLVTEETEEHAIVLPPINRFEEDEDETPAIDFDLNPQEQREIIFDFEETTASHEEEEEIRFVHKNQDSPAPKTEKQPSAPLVTPETHTRKDVEELNKMGMDRVQKLKALSEKLKNHTPIEKNLEELEKIPAYKRREVNLDDVKPSSESNISGMTVSDDPEKGFTIRKENPFLHKNVD